MLPCVEIYWLCCLFIESPSFAHILFSFVSVSLILAKCLVHLKTLQGNFGNLTTVNNISFNQEVHAFRFPRGRKKKGFVGYVKVKLETTSPASRSVWHTN